MSFTTNYLLKLYLKHGLDINRNDNKWGSTLLHTYSSYFDTQQMDLFKTLMEHHPNLNIQDKKGETPINLTFMNDKKFKMLLEAGADVNIKNNEGKTILFKFTMIKKKEIYYLNMEPIPIFKTMKEILFYMMLLTKIILTRLRPF